MLPPPAPTSARSITGVESTYPPPLITLLAIEIGAPTSYSDARAGRPFSTSADFAVVPPMSRVTTSPSPRRVAIDAAATTPAAGPDSRR